MMVHDIDLKLLHGIYRNKPVRFSVSQNRWVYHNNHPVNFQASQARSQTSLSSVPATPAPPGPSHLPTPQTAGTSLAPQRQPSPSPRTQQQLPPVQPAVPAPPNQVSTCTTTNKGTNPSMNGTRIGTPTPPAPESTSKQRCLPSDET